MKKIAFLFAIALVFAGLTEYTHVYAEQDNIRQTDIATVISAQTISASGTFTGRTFKPLQRTTSQSVMVQGTGTSPNYKVEILVSLDGTTFVKPETGGDLGTFTDQNAHIMAVHVPLSPGGHQLLITELGGANSITITAKEASQ
jgi:hypothetical protein